MSIPMRPIIGLSGRPLPVSFVHFLPPSVVFHSPLPGPPPLKPHGTRRRWYEAAKRMFGFDGSITTSVKPVSLSMKFVFVQVFPPSIVLNRPRSGFGPNRWPRAATYAMFGSFGWTTMRPMLWVSFSPTYSNVLPALIDLKTPAPNEELWRLFASPVPT